MSKALSVRVGWQIIYILRSFSCHAADSGYCFVLQCLLKCPDKRVPASNEGHLWRVGSPHFLPPNDEFNACCPTRYQTHGAQIFTQHSTVRTPSLNCFSWMIRLNRNYGCCSNVFFQRASNTLWRIASYNISHFSCGDASHGQKYHSRRPRIPTKP